MPDAYFSGLVRDGKIFEVSGNGTTIQLGVTLREHEELQQQLDELIPTFNDYQQLLIENKLIEVPKTTDEQIAELMEMNKSLSKQVEQLVSLFGSKTGTVPEVKV